MMQNHALVKTPVQQFEPWLYQQDAKPCASKDISSTIRAMVIPASATHAEMLWTLKVVINHYSLRSCLGLLNELFRSMFNDSEVAKSFSLSKTKCMYYMNYGLGPYFKEELVKTVKASPYFSLSFDETLNGEIQEQQLGIPCHVTYWDDNRKEVCSRYFDIHFLRCLNAQNILNLLQHSLNELLPQCMIQVSIDGPVQTGRY